MPGVFNGSIGSIGSIDSIIELIEFCRKCMNFKLNNLQSGIKGFILVV